MKNNEEVFSVSTGILMSTLWNQNGILELGDNTTVTYNEYCPLDGSVHSLTGCTNTAAAQILYYFIEKDILDLELTLTVDDEYTSSYNSDININIKSDGSAPGTISFAEINQKLSDYDLDSADDAAALLYACGVVQQANYSAAATSTAFYDTLFYRSGFSVVNYIYLPYDSYWTKMINNNLIISAEGFDILIENLTAGKVIGASIPNHAIVIDGYNAENDTFHLNYGWGRNDATRWYSRDEMNSLRFNVFILDLSPENITDISVSNSAVYGTDTFLRAIELAEVSKGKNVINFSSEVKDSDIKLTSNLSITEDLEINDLNINLTAETGIFYSNHDIDLDLNNVSGNLISNCNSAYTFMLNTKSFDLSTSGAILYSGSYTVDDDRAKGTAALIEALEYSQQNNSELDEQILNKKNYAIYSYYTTEDCEYEIADNSLIVGNIMLGYGDNTITVSNSRVYGNISAGSGNNTLIITDNSKVFSDNTGIKNIIISGNSTFSSDFYKDINITLQLRADANDAAMVNIENYCQNFRSYCKTLTVDASNAQSGIYSLISCSEDALYKYVLEYLEITLNVGNNQKYTLSANGTNSCEHGYIFVEDDTLKLQITNSSLNDNIKPSVPNGLTAEIYGNSVYLDWNDSTDNDGIKSYFFRYGTSASLSGDGTEVKSSKAVLSDIANGKYYYQVRAEDYSGNLSDWSEIKSFNLNYVPGTVNIYSDGKILSSGNVMTDKRLENTHSMIISSGGTASNTHILSGGTQTVSNGGSAVSSFISSGGTALVSSGGKISESVANDSGLIILSRGGTASDLKLNSGGSLRINASGTAYDVQISSGAIVNGFVFQDNVTSYSTLNNIFSANNVNINNSAYISTGMVINNINLTGYLTVSSGGTAFIKYSPWQKHVDAYQGAVVNYLTDSCYAYLGNSVSGLISHTKLLDSTAVSSGLSAIIHSGGAADNATVSSGGFMYVYDHGKADNTTVKNYGKMHIYSGGTVTDTTIESGGLMYVSCGGAANNTIVNSKGHLYVYSEGTANNTTVNKYGGMTIISGGTANYAEINGSAFINEGIINNALVNSDGRLYVSSGGVAKNTVVKSFGYVNIAGKADTVNLLDHASAFVQSTGSVSKVIIDSRSYLILRNEYDISSIDVNSAGRLYFENADIDTQINMERGGVMLVQGNCNANCNITINGTLETNILGIGYLNMQGYDLTLDLTQRFASDGYFIDDIENISNANIAINISETQSSGIYEIMRYAADFTDTVTVKCGDITEKLSIGSSVTINDITCTLNAASGYYDTITMEVKNSGTETLPEIAEYQPGTWSTDWRQASEYAKARNLPVFACYGDPTQCPFAGYMISNLFYDPDFLEFAKENLVLLYDVVPNGKAYGGSPAGYLLTHSGDKIASISGFGADSYKTWMQWLKLNAGKMNGVYSEDDSEITFLGDSVSSDFNKNGQIIHVANAKLYDSIIQNYASASIKNNGKAENIDINKDGYMYVYNNGTADNTIINSRGFMHVSSGGAANDITVNAMAYLHISSGGYVKNTKVNSKGYMYVSSGGTAVNTELYQGRLYNEGITDDAEIFYGGSMTVSSGGIANNTQVNANGYVHILSGCSANNTTINDSGTMYINSGGTHTGNLKIHNDGYFYVNNGGIINFDLTDRTITDNVFTNDLTKVKANPTYTITVSQQMNDGIYKIAGNIYEFNKSISVGDGTSIYGKLYADGKVFEHNGRKYSLDINKNTLVFIVGDCDFVPPKTPVVSADITEFTKETVTITAVFCEDSTYKQYSFDNENWMEYTAPLMLDYNTELYFRAVDRSGNVSQTIYLNIDYIFKNPPILEITGNATEWTRNDVILTATANTGVIEYFDGSTWVKGNSITATENGTYKFRATDIAGNVTEEQIVVDKIDKDPPIIEITPNTTEVTNQHVILNATVNEGTLEYYSNGKWIAGSTIVAKENGTYFFRAVDHVGNFAEKSIVVNNINKTDMPHDLISTKDSLSWVGVVNTEKYYVSLIRTNNYSFDFTTSGTEVDLYAPAKVFYTWRVSVDEKRWTPDSYVLTEYENPKKLESDGDGNTDIFIASVRRIWVNTSYCAQHHGIKDQWTGTMENVNLSNKIRYEDIYIGSSDDNIMLLSHNDDALFFEDVFSEFGSQARIAEIKEIRAGAGDDIIDLTGQSFEYQGGGMTIRGGSDNDTIWSNKGENILFGDAGNDRIIGGSDNDIIVGGIGNDSMHGGGGEDIFCFGGDFGNDIVEQLANGKVTLYFESENVKWDENTKQYTDGRNSVALKGDFEVEVIYGRDETLAAIGAFDDFTSEDVFEEKSLIA